MKFNNHKILCIGEVLWDVLPTGVVPGGASMNVALHLAQCRQEVILASSIGQDESGAQLENFLRESGLSTELIQRTSELPTSKVIVTLDGFKNPTFTIIEPVAWDQIKLNDCLINSARDVGLIIYGTLASRNIQTRNTILV